VLDTLRVYAERTLRSARPWIDVNAVMAEHQAAERAKLAEVAGLLGRMTVNDVRSDGMYEDSLLQFSHTVHDSGLRIGDLALKPEIVNQLQNLTGLE
jgi:hypothetical protein